MSSVGLQWHSTVACLPSRFTECWEDLQLALSRASCRQPGLTLVTAQPELAQADKLRLRVHMNTPWHGEHLARVIHVIHPIATRKAILCYATQTAMSNNSTVSTFDLTELSHEATITTMWRHVAHWQKRFMFTNDYQQKTNVPNFHFWTIARNVTVAKRTLVDHSDHDTRLHVWAESRFWIKLNPYLSSYVFDPILSGAFWERCSDICRRCSG